MSRLLLSVCAAALVTMPAPAGETVINASLVGQWDGYVGAYADVWGDGAYAYLGHFGAPSIDIVDIADPTTPTLVQTYLLPPPNESASAQDVKVGDGLLFIGLEGDAGSVHVVDVRDPMNAVPLVDIDIPGYNSIHNVFYHDGYLYLADSGTTRVGIVDLTRLDPDAPPASPITTTKWIVENVGSSIVHDITVVGNRLYACAWDSGIWIYDISDLAAHPPTLLGSAPGDNTHSCWPTDDGKFVITGEERAGGGIIVHRIDENPDGTVTLVVTDQVALPAEASSVHNQTVIGHRVYNSWYGAGLRVYDVSPSDGTLEFRAAYDTATTNSVWGVYPFLGPDRVLISSINAGLFVIDVHIDVSGDLDGDALVGFSDLLLLLLNWGPCPAPPASCPADLDDDGAVGFSDLLRLFVAWS